MEEATGVKFKSSNEEEHDEDVELVVTGGAVVAGMPVENSLTSAGGAVSATGFGAVVVSVADNTSSASPHHFLSSYLVLMKLCNFDGSGV